MIFVIFFIFSTILLVTGLGIIYYKLNLKKNGIRTVGKVIRNEKYVESTLDSFKNVVTIVVYRPVVEFKSKEGIVLQAICDDSSNPPKYKEGDEINIIYPSNDPEDISVYETLDSMELPIVFISLSIIMYIFSIIILLI